MLWGHKRQHCFHLLFRRQNTVDRISTIKGAEEKRLKLRHMNETLKYNKSLCPLE